MSQTVRRLEARLGIRLLQDGRELNVRVDGAAIVNDTRLAVQAAIDGIGIALVMDDLAASALAEKRLVRLLGDWCRPFPGCHLDYPDRRHPSPAFAALLEVLRRRASKLRATAPDRR